MCENLLLKTTLTLDFFMNIFTQVFSVKKFIFASGFNYFVLFIVYGFTMLNTSAERHLKQIIKISRNKNTGKSANKQLHYLWTVDIFLFLPICFYSQLMLLNFLLFHHKPAAESVHFNPCSIYIFYIYKFLYRIQLVLVRKAMAYGPKRRILKYSNKF